MTSASFRVAAAVLISLSFYSSGAFAADIAIDSEDYAQLPASAQEKLVGEMKGKGLLADGDKVTNAAPPAAKEALGPAALLPFVPVVCKIIAEAKKQDELGKCASKPEADAQSKCKTDVEAKFGTIDAVCNIIKIFSGFGQEGGHVGQVTVFIAAQDVSPPSIALALTDAETVVSPVG